MSSQQTDPNGRVLRPVLQVRTGGGVVSVAGEVDATTADDFGSALAACDHEASVVLDLSEVTFFSAAGVRSFVTSGWTTGSHPLVIASEPVRRVLRVCDLGFLLAPHGRNRCSDCSTSMV